MRLWFETKARLWLTAVRIVVAEFVRIPILSSQRRRRAATESALSTEPGELARPTHPPERANEDGFEFLACETLAARIPEHLAAL
jgi:hypothetical protein